LTSFFLAHDREIRSLAHPVKVLVIFVTVVARGAVRAMPIYEFYCCDCHRIFHFLSRKPGSGKRPSCPACGRPRLERKPSTFAVGRGLGAQQDGDPSEIDEAGLERAMASIAGELDGLDEDDPRQAARLMRTLYEAAGVEPGPAVEEAVRRMEAGEDPDTIEEELGDLLEKEDPLSGEGNHRLGKLRRRFLPPTVDETLHEL
jgi:putative FmdB family regulatory protein